MQNAVAGKVQMIKFQLLISKELQSTPLESF